MLGFHDVTVILHIAASDLASVFIAEPLHGKAAFQYIFPHRVHDLLQLRFEHRTVQLLRVPRPPCVPELVATASKVHADMADSTPPPIFFGVRGIK